MISVMYAFSMVLLLAVFLLYPKNDNRQRLLTWIAIALFGYELFACAVGGLLTVLHIPASILTVAIFNLSGAAFLLFSMWKNKKPVQKYTIQLWEIGFLIVSGIVILSFGWDRFEMFAVPNYETSDPGPHLRSAMKCVNNKTVGVGSIVSQFTNALWIEMLEPFFGGAFRYKSFILKDLYNLFLSVVVFLAAFSSKEKKWFDWKAVVITIVYIVGYPLSNLLFGFQYLGLGVTVLGFLYIIATMYIDQEVNKTWLVFFMNLGCIGSVLSYTLFAPVVYFALFGFLTWDFLRTNRGVKLRKDSLIFIGKKDSLISYVKLHLSVFLVPVLYAGYFIILNQAQEGAIPISTALTFEGYIYRNLYSDFLLMLPFALYGWIDSIKEKRWNLFTVFFPLQILYCAYFFNAMVDGDMSTYYFYKLNYLNSLVVFGLGLEGIYTLVRQKAGNFVNCCIAIAACVFMIWSTGSLIEVRDKNINNAPFADEAALFRVYQTNKIYLDRQYFNEDLIKLSEALLELKQDDDRPCLLLANWMYSFWYEALTNQSISTSYAYMIGSQGVLDRFVNDNSFGDYLVVLANSEEAIAVQDQLQNFEVVFSTDTGYIISR